MWDFLSDPTNQKTIGFYAGGIAAVAVGLWKAWTGLRKTPAAKAQAAPAPPRQVSGSNGVAAGGNLQIGGNVTVTRGGMPKGAIALLAAGIVLLGLGAYLSGGGDRMENSIKAGGDIEAGSITIGAPPADGN